MFPQAAAEESHTVDTATNIFILLVAVSAALVAIAGFSVYLRYLRRTEDHDSRYYTISTMFTISLPCATLSLP